MNFKIALLIFTCAISLFASELRQTCELATSLRSGPYTSLEFIYDVVGGRLESLNADVSVTYSKESGKVGKRIVTFNEVALELNSKRQTIKLAFEDSDWQRTEIELGQDDKGTAAFVTFNSDGPDFRSFYRCSGVQIDIDSSLRVPGDLYCNFSGASTDGTYYGRIGQKINSDELFIWRDCIFSKYICYHGDAQYAAKLFTNLKKVLSGGNHEAPLTPFNVKECQPDPE